MKIVIDTNIVFSAILNSQSRIGQVLLHSDLTIKFYSPKFLKLEIEEHFEKIKKFTNLPDKEIYELIDIFYTKINFISEELIPKSTLILADKITSDIDFEDVMFVALTIHLNGNLWTGDKTLMNALRLKGFDKFITSKELIDNFKK